MYGKGGWEDGKDKERKSENCFPPLVFSQRNNPYCDSLQSESEDKVFLEI
jgi:hypothetical protein